MRDINDLSIGTGLCRAAGPRPKTSPCDTEMPSSPDKLPDTLRFDDNGANLAASLNGLMRRGRFVKREARSHRPDAPRHRDPCGDVGLRPLAVGVRHACLQFSPS